MAGKEFFTPPPRPRTTLAEIGLGETEWQELVVGLKKRLTLVSNSPSVVPNDFSGILIVGSLKFSWRCWETWFNRFLNSLGELQDTRWNFPHFSLALPQDIGSSQKKRLVARGQKFYLNNYEAIHCAIIERCVEEKKLAERKRFRSQSASGS